MTKWLSVAIALLLMLLLAAISVSVGAVSVPLREIVPSLLQSDHPSYFIVHQLRLPRVLVGILAGFGLAVGGVILQSLIRNPLASPDVIGITKGAGLAAALMIYAFPLSPAYMLPAAAFIGAIGTFGLLIPLSRRLTLPPASLALVGVALGAVLAAGTQYMIVMHPSNVNAALLWLAGSMWNRSWQDVWSLLPWMAILLPIAWSRSQELNVFQLSEETVASLGVRIFNRRFWLMLLAVAMSGVSVASVGAIGFIGLIAPHIARRIVGPAHQWLIPLSALIGADLMLLGDVLGRILIIPREVPVGVMTALIGAPYFVLLLRREWRRKAS